jgi:hypothetical protein
LRFSITVEKPYQLHNSENPLDVNDDTHVSSIDALLIIDVLNHPPGLTPQSQPNTAALAPALYLDTSRDNHISSIDALLVINALNSGPGGEEEADGSSAAPGFDDIMTLLSIDAAAQPKRRPNGR